MVSARVMRFGQSDYDSGSIRQNYTEGHACGEFWDIPAAPNRVATCLQ